MKSLEKATATATSTAPAAVAVEGGEGGGNSCTSGSGGKETLVDQEEEHGDIAHSEAAAAAAGGGGAGGGGGGGGGANGPAGLELLPTPNKDMPVPQGVAKAIFEAAQRGDVDVLKPLVEMWAGNAQAIDGYKDGHVSFKSTRDK